MNRFFFQFKSLPLNVFMNRYRLFMHFRMYNWGNNRMGFYKAEEDPFSPKEGKSIQVIK
jgi:hypothetical protein